MGPFEMVVAIVAIGGLVSIARARAGILKGKEGGEFHLSDRETARLKDEMKALKERVAVLERIVTENDRGGSLAREIDALRSRT